jgi:hypothetical protein
MNKNFSANCTIVLTVFALSVLVYHCKNPKIESGYYSPEVLATHSSGEHFVGSETCLECHADIYTAHKATAHYQTSAVADSSNIEGSFKDGSNTLDLESVKFTIVSDANSFYQYTEIKNRNIEIPPKKLDVVIGSGVRGQTYATWKEDKLFQLQPSYYTPNNSWVNSPGYPQHYLERPIRDACLKCHVTFAVTRNLPGQGNQYEKDKMMYGIGCEKCHRPSEKHVVYHRKHPDATTAQFMTPLDSLSRQQKLDVCAQCHSGPRSQILKGNSFSFLAGDNLNDFTKNIASGALEPIPDVHGNQYRLLTQSECFKQATTMDCSTCHNPHQNQRGDFDYFNQKCFDCHKGRSTVCSAEPEKKHAMGNNCIACHMPVTPSKTMTVQLSPADSLETSFYIRTHLIGIYPKGSPLN